MTVSVVTDNSATTGEVNVTWTDDNPTDWRSWRLSAKPTAGVEWTVLYETFVDDPTFDVDIYNFIDGVAADYSVTYTSQSLTGPLVVEAYTDTTTITPTGDGLYHLIDAVDNANSITLHNVTSFPVSLEYEQATYLLLGRGRKLDVGDRLGYSGSISGTLFDNATQTAKEQRMDMENLRASSSSFFLREPFGRTYQVQVSGLSFTPTPGTGTSEHQEYSFEILEVGGVPIGVS